MTVFIRGERVRIVEPERDSDKVYIIKSIKKIKGRGILYLLRSLEEDSSLRLYYENKESLFERMY
jgi:hypothetical protein